MSQKNMRYFFIYPFKPQYYFPEDFADGDFLSGFFTPYTRTGSVWWWLLRKFAPIRHACSIDESGIPFLKQIRDITGENWVFAINLGTEGQEQKTTAIGIEKDGVRRFFVKYAEKEKSRQLVANEYQILRKLTYMPGIPELLNYHITSSGTLLQTSFIEGVKYNETVLNNQLFELLTKLMLINREGCNDYSGEFEGKKVFAHGDFCPWNMLVSKGRMHLVDWEMAGFYPAGYDLFTFIFQTRFLLQTSSDPTSILESNMTFIHDYFSRLGITDWRKYLNRFAQFKLDIYSVSNPLMAEKYSELLNIKN